MSRIVALQIRFTIVAMQNKVEAISEAKKRLTQFPFDIYHTFDHHLCVWQNALEIVFSDKLKVDLDALEVATFWHDVFKGKEEQQPAGLSSALSALGLNSESIQKITTIIGEHTFGKQQNSDEARTLYDADKLEYISILRWKAGFDVYEAGAITIEQRDIHIPNLNKRLPLLRESLNFESSKQMFDKKLTLFKDFMNSLGRYKDNIFI